MNKSLIISFLAVFSVLPTHAAELTLDSPVTEAGIGQIVETKLVLDTQHEAINVVGGEIFFPAELLEITAIKDGNSIISFWIEKPHLENGRIVFVGVIPGGYTGEQGPIFSFQLRTKQTGTAVITVGKGVALLNDGQGSNAPLSIVNSRLAISSDFPIGSLISEKDVYPPEQFQPEIARQPSIFDNHYFVAFTAQDKDAGLDHYELLEKRALFQPSFKQGKLVTSPYLLEDQELKSWILLKAVDRSGNERVVVIAPTNVRFYERPSFIVLILIAVLLLYIVGRTKRKKARK